MRKELDCGVGGTMAWLRACTAYAPHVVRMLRTTEYRPDACMHEKQERPPLGPRAEVSRDYWAADKVRMCVIGLAGWNGAARRPCWLRVADVCSRSCSAACFSDRQSHHTVGSL